MKYLSEYTSEGIEKMLKNNGAFFAFSDKQFDEAKAENLTREDYCHIFGGMIAPKENAQKIMLELAEINKKGIEEDIKDNGIVGIIKRELSNHECYYTGDTEPAIDALSAYNVTAEQVQKVFRNQNLTAEAINWTYENNV